MPANLILPPPADCRGHWSIIHGDALEQLRCLREDLVRCWVTSPPYYGQVDYGVDGQTGIEPTIDEYIAYQKAVAIEMARVSTPDANLFWVVRDTYNGSGGPGGDHRRKDGTYKRTPVRPRVTGWAKQAQLLIPERTRIAFAGAGWWPKAKIIWNKRDALSGKRRGLSYSYEEIHHYVLDPERHYFKRDAVMRMPAKASLAQLTAEYTGRGQVDYAAIGREDPSDKKRRAVQAMRDRGGKCYLLDVWDIPSGRNPVVDMGDGTQRVGKASFPILLAEICVLMGSQPGDTVGDPYAGMGTTLLAAVKHGRNAVGIELNEMDVNASLKRIGGPRE